MAERVDERSVAVALDMIERGHTPGGILQAFADTAGANGVSVQLLADFRESARATVAEAIRRAATVSEHCACAPCSAAELNAATAEAQRIVTAETGTGEADDD